MFTWGHEYTTVLKILIVWENTGKNDSGKALMLDPERALTRWRIIYLELFGSLLSITPWGRKSRHSNTHEGWFSRCGTYFPIILGCQMPWNMGLYPLYMFTLSSVHLKAFTNVWHGNPLNPTCIQWGKYCLSTFFNLLLFHLIAPCKCYYGSRWESLIYPLQILQGSKLLSPFTNLVSKLA